MFPMLNNPPPVDSLSQLLSMHEHVRSDLERQVADVRVRESALRAELEAYVARRAELEDQLQSLDRAGEIYKKTLRASGAYVFPVAPDEKPQIPGASKPPRARIGKQRYQMFLALHQFGSLTRTEIEGHTRLSEKRVREQMLSDIKDGFVTENEADDALSLTPEGVSLLERFQAYQTLKGNKLAKLGELIDGPDDQGDSEKDEDEDAKAFPSSLHDETDREKTGG